MTSAHINIGRRTASAAGWTISTRLTIGGIGLISTVILARLLTPQDFGLVAIAMLLYQVVEILGEFHFNVFLLVKKHAGRDFYDTAWTLSVVRGCVTAVILCLLAAPAASFFEEPRVESIVYLLSLMAVMEGLRNIAIVNFQKEFRFDLDFAYGVSVKLFAFTATITAAFLLRDYTALLIGMLASGAAALILSYGMHPYRPALALIRSREILRYSRWLLFANGLNTTLRRADAFFIGKFIGAAPLGVYSIAFEISSLPTDHLILPIRRALLPGYAKLADAPNELRKAFLDGFALIVILVTPISVGVALTARPIVELLLGSQWLEAIPVIRILALLSFFRACTSNVSPLFLAVGRPELTSLTAGITLVLGLPLVAVGTYAGGIAGTAWGVTAMAAINVALTISIATRLIDASLSTMFRSMWRTVVSTVVMCVPVTLVSRLPYFAQQGLLAAELLLQISVGIISFIGVQLLLWRLSGCPEGPEIQVLRILRPMFEKSR